jgi:beta-aspartyl-peptidase (threonine type)
VLLAAHGARRLAHEIGMDATDPGWFVVPHRPEDAAPGTVGAGVLDEQGGLAAATSTGGRSRQAAGRVGDTPLIGAGTWADGRRAISMTGHGEAIVLNASAHSIALSPAPLEEACGAALTALAGSDAGLIAVDAGGRIAMPFNTRVMHRGWWTGGAMETRVGAS